MEIGVPASFVVGGAVCFAVSLLSFMDGADPSVSYQRITHLPGKNDPSKGFYTHVFISPYRITRDPPEEVSEHAIVMRRRNSIVTGSEVKLTVGLHEFVQSRQLEDAHKLSEKFNSIITRYRMPMTAMEMCQSLEGLIMMMRHAERNNDASFEMLSNERQARILAEDSLKAEAKLRQAAEEETCMWQDKAVALKHQAAELENEIARLRAENEKLKKEMTSVN